MYTKKHLTQKRLIDIYENPMKYVNKEEFTSEEDVVDAYVALCMLDNITYYNNINLCIDFCKDLKYVESEEVIDPETGAKTNKYFVKLSELNDKLKESYDNDNNKHSDEYVDFICKTIKFGFDNNCIKITPSVIKENKLETYEIGAEINFNDNEKLTIYLPRRTNNENMSIKIISLEDKDSDGVIAISSKLRYLESVYKMKSTPKLSDAEIKDKVINEPNKYVNYNGFITGEVAYNLIDKVFKRLLENQPEIVAFATLKNIDLNNYILKDDVKEDD